MSNSRYGINMKKYCREHEAVVKRALEDSEASEELLAHHNVMLARIQHERLIHLIVTMMVAIPGRLPVRAAPTLPIPAARSSTSPVVCVMAPVNDAFFCWP